MTKILLVEDDALLLEVMQSILEAEGYEICPAANGKVALDLFVNTRPDLVISDIMMPEMNGFDLLESIRVLPEGVTVPILFLSARTERSDVDRARSLGVDDYLFKPFDAPELINAVRARLDRRRVVELFDTRAAHLQTVIMLANVIETRDPYTAGHLERVRRLALNLAFALNWNTEDVAILEFGAILHDIGKIVVPRQVLKKTGPLSKEEWKLMRQHPEVGAKMLESVDHLKSAVPYVLNHHEWWNGTGYPSGLKGMKIPREGRLLAIVDAFDAMTSNRPYHASMTAAEAIEEIARYRDIYFDPDMVDAFIQTYKL
ncbi:MAG TPA: HD domain-containing phosphohydrolase [Anaerolineales bacterium]|nr:HD domain-containing phosphohydrolase [Anaerolineales bacterium]